MHCTSHFGSPSSAEVEGEIQPTSVFWAPACFQENTAFSHSMGPNHSWGSIALIHIGLGSSLGSLRATAFGYRTRRPQPQIVTVNHLLEDVEVCPLAHTLLELKRLEAAWCLMRNLVNAVLHLRSQLLTLPVIALMPLQAQLLTLPVIATLHQLLVTALPDLVIAMRVPGGFRHPHSSIEAIHRKVWQHSAFAEVSHKAPPGTKQDLLNSGGHTVGYAAF